jgi:hypothetical protein
MSRRNVKRLNKLNAAMLAIAKRSRELTANFDFDAVCSPDLKY